MLDVYSRRIVAWEPRACLKETLVLAALLTVSLSVLLDLPFNFANVIVLPLLIAGAAMIVAGCILAARKPAEASPTLEAAT